MQQTVVKRGEAEQHVACGGGLLSTLNSQAVSAAEKNRRIADELARGRVLVGEYHARLSIDQIFLAENYAKLQKEYEAICKKEQQLEKRLAFLFEDSKRLSHDNDLVMREGKEKEKLLSELHLQLELQSSKYKGSKRKLLQEQEQKEMEAGFKVKARENWRKTKEKLVKQHQHIWALEDEIEYLKVEVAALQVQVKKLAADAETAMPRKQSILDTTTESTTPRHAACERDDCVLMRKMLREVQIDIKRHARSHRTVRFMSGNAMPFDVSLSMSALSPSALSPSPSQFFQ